MPSVRATRGRRRRTHGAAAALALTALLLSSCGDDSNAGLSQERASNLRAALDRVEGSVKDGDCTGAAQQASGFHADVASLPNRVDRDLRQALESSASRLEALVSEQCRPAAAQEAPVQEAPAPDQNAGDQQGRGKKDKQPKEQKPPKQDQQQQQPPDTGVTGQEGSTGVTGQDGGAVAPEAP
jgi:hypothetical protein